jgi:glycosyltransferase involved in cell wall biosynthesis
MIRVVHVVTSISRESSGPSRSVPALCAALREQGIDASLVYVDYGATPEVGVPTLSFERTRVPGLRQGGFSLGLLRYLLSCQADIIHAHGMWELPGLFALARLALTGIPIVVSPRGTLGPWAMSRSAIKKQVALRLGFRALLERSSFIHVTSASEAEEVRRFGLNNTIVMAPNVVEPAALPEDLAVRRAPVVLFLSRLHPGKQVEILLRAWPMVHAICPSACLEIAGPDEDGYRAKLETECSALGLCNVAFLGELRGEEKRAAMGRADVFAFPTRSENFGMVVAEAALSGALVVCSRGAPWSVLDEHRAGRWIEATPELFARAIVELLCMPPEQKSEMRVRARSLVLSMFGASAAEPLARAYAQVLAGRTTPETQGTAQVFRGSEGR